MDHWEKSNAARAGGEGDDEEQWRMDLAAAWGQSKAEREAIRSQYAAVKGIIRAEKDGADPRRLGVAMRTIEGLHRKVRRPKEQVADGEALLELVNSLTISAKLEKKDGPTPSEFVTALVRKFGVGTSPHDASIIESSSWSDIGAVASPLFMTATGCQTMNGPINIAIKERKGVARRLFDRFPSRPSELDEAIPHLDQRNDTDKNMAVMFKLLRKNQCVKLENIVLNRHSFAQTVENIFALSFLVKDGRVEITVDHNGDYLVMPRNAPAAEVITSRKVINHQFVFRFDTKDWRIMKGIVEHGNELMPRRENNNGGLYYNTETCSEPRRKSENFAKREAMEETFIKRCSVDDMLNKRRKRSEASSFSRWFSSCDWQ